MIDLIRELAAKRDHLVLIKDAKRRMFIDWQETHKDFLAQCEKETVEVAELEKVLRESAITIYRETGNSHPVPGVEVKLFQELTYDPGQALVWAKEHGIALKLDEKAFEKIAKVSSLSFVSKDEVPRAQIATDLGKALDKEVK